MDASDINSVLLSEWADIAIFFGSSISYQLILDEVPLIYPKYVTSNDIFLEDMDVCIPVYSQIDVAKILSTPKEDIKSLLCEKNRSFFIDTVIYGGNNKEMFMREYYKYMTFTN
jgi:hypothetical protein